MVLVVLLLLVLLPLLRLLLFLPLPVMFLLILLLVARCPGFACMVNGALASSRPGPTGPGLGGFRGPAGCVVASPEGWGLGAWRAGPPGTALARGGWAPSLRRASCMAGPGSREPGAPHGAGAASSPSGSGAW